MPIITPGANVANLINMLNGVIKLNPAIVLTGDGKAATVKSVIRDVGLLDGVWKLVKAGYKADKKLNEILSQASTTLGPTYRPLYKSFDSQIKQHVKQMYKRLNNKSG
jgi:cyclase